MKIQKSISHQGKITSAVLVAIVTLAISFTISLLCQTKNVFAVVDTTSGELQDAANLIAPSGENFGTLKGYSAFVLQDKTAITNGLTIKYTVRLSADPWQNSELPELQILIYSYSSQDGAEAAFESLLASHSFKTGAKTLLESTDHYFFFETKENYAPDMFATINSEYISYHMVERNGNLIFQSSLYRTDGEFDSLNLQTYALAMSDPNNVKSILSKSIERTKSTLALIFPPTEALISSQSENTSLNLSALYDVPHHGSVDLKVYVGNLTGATGTILDSSGVSTPEEGDVYLYINGNGEILAGMYAPNFDADCSVDAGWYRLSGDDPLIPYEWNDVSIHFGVGGFHLGINGVTVSSCNLSQSFSGRTLYAGDYPLDGVSESMIGYIDNVTTAYSLTDSGEKWDHVLTDQLFLDLPNTDPNLQIFQYLKEEGIFTGSDGMLYPDNVLNRAEMVKIILKAFNRSVDVEYSVPFTDIPEDAWYGKYIAKAYKIGMAMGHSDGTFQPGTNINQAEFFTMLYRLKGSSRMRYDGEFSDVSEDDWFALGAEFAHQNGLMSGIEFLPEQTISRREAAKALYTLLKSS
ncbi:MAG: S-layer homology domain-containing protein [Candidatus Gracilibacteria bacterium]